MSRTLSVKFRGADQDVEVDRDYGYERDTNAHDVDWHFPGLTAEEYAALRVTDEEEADVHRQLCEKLEADHADE